MIRKLEMENLTYAFPEVAFDEDYVLATYAAKVSTHNIEKLAMAIAAEQTTGTWIKVGADSLEKTKRFGSKIVALYEVPDIGNDWQSDEPPMYVIQVAYPMENFSTSMSAIETILFGNISASGMIKLIDVAFPKKFIDKFQGPKFGVEGLKDAIGVKDRNRPLLNAMIKPNIGWTPDEGADLFYHACKGGVDVIKDDELMLADGPFCPLEERVKKFMAMEKRVYEEKGEHSLYAVNVSDNTDKVKENAYRVLEAGGNCLMVNVYTTGHDTLKMLADDPNINVPILAHVNYAGTMAASTYTGISAPVIIGKLTRLAGGDFQINGHPYGKFPVLHKIFYRTFKFFTQPWWHIKPMMYACSGGTIQMAVEKIVKEIGTDIMLAAGGGVHGHPDGSEAGAKSMRQAIDAAMKDIPVTEYAKDHPELARMLAFLNPDLKKNFDLMQ